MSFQIARNSSVLKTIFFLYRRIRYGFWKYKKYSSIFEGSVDSKLAC